MSPSQGCLALCLAVMLSGAVGAAPPVDRDGDPLPPGAVARLGSTRLRPPGGALSLAFPPDGKVLATADGNALRLWDFASGKQLWAVREYHHPPNPPLCFLPDGKAIVS